QYDRVAGQKDRRGQEPVVVVDRSRGKDQLGTGQWTPRLHHRQGGRIILGEHGRGLAQDDLWRSRRAGAADSRVVRRYDIRKWIGRLRLALVEQLGVGRG